MAPVSDEIEIKEFSIGHIAEAPMEKICPHRRADAELGDLRQCPGVSDNV